MFSQLLALFLEHHQQSLQPFGGFLVNNGNNFCDFCDFLFEVSFPAYEHDALSEKGIVQRGADSFLLKSIPFHMGGNTIWTVASLESVFIPL